jgi:hypothetical protein
MLERPDVVNDAIISMLNEVRQSKGRRRFLRGRDREGARPGERKGEEDVA